MTLENDTTARVTEAGTGRPVLVLGRGFAASPGFAALAEAFHVFAMEDGDTDAAAAWIAAQSFERLGVVGLGAAARAAIEVAASAGEKANALVLVSPAGLPLGEPDDPFSAQMRALMTPTCVLIGDAADEDAGLASWRKAFARCHTVLVYASGSDIAVERPQAFASAAGDFLDRQGRFTMATESVAIER